MTELSAEKLAAREANRWRWDASVAPPEGANLTQTVHENAAGQKIVQNGPPAQPKPKAKAKAKAKAEPKPEPETKTKTEETEA